MWWTSIYVAEKELQRKHKKTQSIRQCILSLGLTYERRKIIPLKFKKARKPKITSWQVIGARMLGRKKYIISLNEQVLLLTLRHGLRRALPAVQYLGQVFHLTSKNVRSLGYESRDLDLPLKQLQYSEEWTLHLNGQTIELTPMVWVRVCWPRGLENRRTGSASWCLVH